PPVEAAAPAPVAAAEATPAASAAVAAPPAATVPPPPAPPVAAPVPGAATASVADLVHGQTIYRQACAFCHDKGVAGAPKTGDAAAWAPRIAQGVDTLHAVAVKGKGAMPAKGGNPALGEADVHAAVDFMIAQSR
ncbi:MAG: c-type cytochrome, partial [Thiobacillus sp.]